MLYAYSPDTGELINTTTPADWMSTTAIAPPAYDPATSGCFFQNGAWVIVSSLPKILSDAQAKQIAMLHADYQAAIAAPVNYTTSAGTTASFSQDATSISNLQEALAGSAKSQAWPLNLWLNVAGQPVMPFTYADLQGLAAAFEAADVPQYQTLLTQIAAVTAATTVAAAQAITW